MSSSLAEDRPGSEVEPPEGGVVGVEAELDAAAAAAAAAILAAAAACCCWCCWKRPGIPRCARFIGNGSMPRFTWPAAMGANGNELAIYGGIR